MTLAEEVGLTRFDPDYYAIQLGNNVLGGGFYATRLYHDLRQVAGLVYNVDDSFAAGKTRSVYTVTFGSDPPNVTKARDLIVRDLRAMQMENVTPEELHQAKALLLRQMALQQSSEDAIAGILLARAQIGLPLDESRRMGQRYYDLTADEVRAAFAKWIRPQDFVQVFAVAGGVCPAAPVTSYTLRMRRFLLAAIGLAAFVLVGDAQVRPVRHGRGRPDAGPAAPADDGQRAPHRRASRRRGFGVHCADGARRPCARRVPVAESRRGRPEHHRPRALRRARRHPHRGAAAGAARSTAPSSSSATRSTTASRSRARKPR